MISGLPVEIIALLISTTKGVYIYERIFLEQLHTLVAKILAVKVDDFGAVIVQEASQFNLSGAI